MCLNIVWLRGLKNILRMHVKKVNCSEWEQIPVPSRYTCDSIIYALYYFLFNLVFQYIVIFMLHLIDVILFDSSVRAIVALNLHNYGSGRNPWGNLKPEYLEKVGNIFSLDEGIYCVINIFKVFFFFYSQLFILVCIHQSRLNYSCLRERG